MPSLLTRAERLAQEAVKGDAKYWRGKLKATKKAQRAKAARRIHELSAPALGEDWAAALQRAAVA